VNIGPVMADFVQCDDFLQFQKALKKMRVLDDKIIYALNLSTPTESIQARGISPTERCTQLRRDLDSNNASREGHIRNCIAVVSLKVENLKVEYDSGNQTMFRDLKISQGKLRMYKNELNVEDIIKNRTESIFKAKCQEYL